MTRSERRTTRRVLPGFPLAMTVTATSALVFVFIPLATVIATASRLTPRRFATVALDPRARAAYGLSLSTSLAAAIISTMLGLVIAWVLTRYRFPFRLWLDALVDVPVALPTAVLGLALAALWSGTLAFTRAGITLALTILGFPLVVRAVAPVLSTTANDPEEASATLGATRWQTFTRVTVPAITPAILTGVTLAFARAVGEYGSVVFLAGNMPFRTELAPLLIMTRIEEFDDAGAAAIATVLLLASLALLLLTNRLQHWATSRLSDR